MKTSPSKEEAIAAAAGGRRLSEEQAVDLFGADLLDLGRAADEVRRRLHPEPVVTFIIDRNVNYTNVCSSGCSFCAFYRNEDDPEAYLLSQGEIHDKIAETLELEGTAVMLQGGLHPRLGIDYYEKLLRSIKKRFAIHIHSFGPPEIVHVAKVSGLSVKETLRRLRDSGLDSLPGGGAEILVDEVRHKISPNKISSRPWMEVMRAAHEIGMKTTATMMFGSIESYADRVEHMRLIRDLQDGTAGFRAFIGWTYQPGHTQLGGETASGLDYLKTLAIARLYLDNVENIQASWVTQGPKIGQLALAFGANDLGSTMIEENVVKAAGVSHSVPMESMIRMIRDAGYTPAQRTTAYEIVRTF
ncbi:MAG: dehypoxanthine futalosine cyclase [Actinobacteria bacterium]|nr:MAG: dehypoxanthine futalosine cyclase [Actinomycetota bacterium]